MRVKELIEILSKFDENAVVYVYDGEALKWGMITYTDIYEDVGDSIVIDIRDWQLC